MKKRILAIISAMFIIFASTFSLTSFAKNNVQETVPYSQSNVVAGEIADKKSESQLISQKSIVIGSISILTICSIAVIVVVVKRGVEQE